LQRADVAAVMAARGNRPLFLVDIAVPRDIAPDVEQLDNVYLYNVDHLEAIVRENVRLREQELARCQTIIGGRVSALMARLMPVPETNSEPAVQAPADWALGGVATCPT
jgi:glutamyl-tRNA reductase